MSKDPERVPEQASRPDETKRNAITPEMVDAHPGAFEALAGVLEVLMPYARAYAARLRAAAEAEKRLVPGGASRKESQRTETEDIPTSGRRVLPSRCATENAPACDGDEKEKEGPGKLKAGKEEP